MGYAIAGNRVPQLLTEIRPTHSAWVFFDISMNLAVILVAVNMYFTIPIQQIPPRDIILKRVLKASPDNKLAHRSVSVLFLAFSSIVATVFTDITNILSLIGSFCCCFIVVIYPGLCYAKLIKNESRSTYYVVMAETIVISLVSFVSCIVVTLDSLGIYTLPS